MLSSFIEFCTDWIGKDPRWPTIVAILMVVLVLVGPRKMITIKKTGESKWTIVFK